MNTQIPSARVEVRAWRRRQALPAAGGATYVELWRRLIIQNIQLYLPPNPHELGAVRARTHTDAPTLKRCIPGEANVTGRKNRIAILRRYPSLRGSAAKRDVNSQITLPRRDHAGDDGRPRRGDSPANLEDRSRPGGFCRDRVAAVACEGFID